MRILLINPPFQRLKGLRAVYFPLGLGYLAARLREAGFEVGIHNAEIPGEKLPGNEDVTLSLQQHHKYVEALEDSDHYVWGEMRDTLARFDPDVVGISVMTAKYGSALKVSSLCKCFKKDIRVIWGGPHPTIQAREVLKNNEVDFAVVGEGDETLSELCQSLRGNGRSFEEIRGLAFRKNGETIVNPPRPLISDLDTLLPPARDLCLHPELYSLESWGNLITSRGCPFECAFCSARSTWGRRVRLRSAENVVAEIRDICHRYKTREIWFWDDSFTVNRSNVLELCHKIVEQRLDISWGCTTRVDTVDDELLDMMRKSGCQMIEFGIESGSERMLKLMKKNITLNQVREAVSLVKKHGIDWKAFFMVGVPGETRIDIEQTKRLMEELDPRGIVLSVFTPYPGSELYDTAVKAGLVPAKPDWSRFSHQSPENCLVDGISREEFRATVSDLARLIDRHNHDLGKACRYLKVRFRFFLRHPRSFFGKAISYAGSRRVGRSKAF
jgi:anaerobic magnesium-protoporphyrin IX monomethyl ester cyclase